MSKKDFIALADALRWARPDRPGFANEDVFRFALAQWLVDVMAVARICHASNSAFKEDRWLAYINGECGSSGGKVRRVA